MRSAARYWGQWAVLSPMEHMYYFADRTLRWQLLESCGFTVVDSRPVLDLEPNAVMNAKDRHAPAAWRARAYRLFVWLFGPLMSGCDSTERTRRHAGVRRAHWGPAAVNHRYPGCCRIPPLP